MTTLEWLLYNDTINLLKCISGNYQKVLIANIIFLSLGSVHHWLHTHCKITTSCSRLIMLLVYFNDFACKTCKNLIVRQWRRTQLPYHFRMTAIQSANAFADALISTRWWILRLFSFRENFFHYPIYPAPEVGDFCSNYSPPDSCRLAPSNRCTNCRVLPDDQKQARRHRSCRHSNADWPPQSNSFLTTSAEETIEVRP